MAYKSIFSPFKSRPKISQNTTPPLTQLVQILGINFSIWTWMLVGASIQALAVFLFASQRYTLLAAVTILIIRIIRGLIQASDPANPKVNPYLQDVVPGRVTALLPDDDSGEITEASSDKVVVFLLGAKSNHPFGIFAPKFAELNGWVTKMNELFDAGDVDGFMGQSFFTRQDERGAVEVSLISYWRSIEDLWAFAHGGVHREAWKWWEKTIKDNGYLGINHELFEADPKHWENIYVNFQPTLMGATTFLKKKDGEKVQGVVADEWISPLVDARRGKLAKSSARLGREVSRYDASRVAKEVYE